MDLPTWAEAPCAGAIVRSFSDMDIVWECPDGSMPYQFRDWIVDEPEPPKSRTPLLLTVAAASGAAFALAVEVVRALT